jgi:hypothetical protein
MNSKYMSYNMRARRTLTENTVLSILLVGLDLV